MATTEELALTGGAKIVPTEAHRGWPDIDEEDHAAVAAVLDRRVLCGPNAPEISALEREWREYLGVDYTLALNSGTAALHCCCAAAGLEPGDEVIVPAFTFIATAMAVVHQGGVPVFCDVDPRTYNLDARLVEERITDRTRAVMPVHIHGLPADMDEINAVAGRRGLAVLEDAAQGHGAIYRGRKVGTLAHSAAFSLNATKNLCGGEGGLFVTNDPDAYRAARRLSTFGEDVPALEPGELRSYWSHAVGWNYRNQELSSALARSQLRRLDGYNAVAQRNGAILSKGLAQVGGVIPPYVPDDRTHVYHKYRVRLDGAALGFDGEPTELRDRVVQALRAEGVEAVLWQAHPLPAYPAFRRELRPWHRARDGEPLRRWDPSEFPQASRLLDESLVLGSEAHPLFAQPPELMERYVDAFRKVIENLEAVLAAPFVPVALR
ncbi:MAG: DegT/DnrJ/EryC1/StrS family aminotransferase [Actinomycetota bacterium]|nr:DegT/DnrJ/EryC1/StrS family aminotransferase [Actinomycetota bacterium]